MIISNNKPIRIIGYPESTMTQEFVNEISKTHSVQVVEPSVFLKENDKNQYQYIIAVSVDLDERKYLVKLASQLDLDLITVINDTSLLGNVPPPIILPGTFIFPFCNLSLGSRIGQHSIIGAYSQVGHYSYVGDNCILRPGVMINGKSHIGNNCIINTKVTITDGAVIADDTEIQAFTNIVQDITQSGLYIKRSFKKY